MRRTLFRSAVVGTVIALVAASAATSAFAQGGHSRFGGFVGVQGGKGGFGPGGLFGGGFQIGSGMGGPGLGGPGFAFGFGRGGLGGPGGPHGGPGGGGIFTSDVLTPAASFLGISVSTLAGDLNGGKTLAQEATAKGKTATDLINAIVAAQKTNLDNEKAAGWITADQETALLQQYTNEVTALVNTGPGVPAGGGQQSGPLQAAATFLGMSVSDIQSALKSGKTLADLAKAANKSVDDLVQALIAPAKSNLDQAVKNGKITQAQENTILSNLTTRATNFVNGTKPTTTQTNSLKMLVARYTTLHAFAKLHH